MKAEDYSTRILEVEGQQIRLTSYRIDTQYHCTADNVDPGAWIPRGEGASREEAEQRVLERVRQRLSRTRRAAAS